MFWLQTRQSTKFITRCEVEHWEISLQIGGSSERYRYSSDCFDVSVCVCELLRCHLDSLHCGKAVSRPFVAPLYVNRCHRGQPPPRVGSTGRTIPVIPMMWRDVTWGDMTWWSSVDLIELGFVDLIGPKFCRKIMQTTELSLLSHKVRVPFMWKVFCILSVGTHFTNLILGECFHQHYSKTNLSQAAPNFNKKRSW